MARGGDALSARPSLPSPFLGQAPKLANGLGCVCNLACAMHICTLLKYTHTDVRTNVWGVWQQYGIIQPSDLVPTTGQNGRGPNEKWYSPSLCLANEEHETTKIIITSPRTNHAKHYAVLHPQRTCRDELQALKT